MLHRKNNIMKKRQNLCFIELTRLSRSCHWHDISRAFCRIPTFFLEIRTEKPWPGGSWNKLLSHFQTQENQNGGRPSQTLPYDSDRLCLTKFLKQYIKFKFDTSRKQKIVLERLSMRDGGIYLSLPVFLP